MSAVAQFEREKIGERTRDVKRQRLAEGYFVGGAVKWGLTVVDGKFVADVKKTALIAQMKAWRSQGKSLRDIVARVVERGEPISVDRVRTLTNDVATAEMHRRGRRKKS